MSEPPQSTTLIPTNRKREVQVWDATEPEKSLDRFRPPVPAWAWPLALLLYYGFSFRITCGL